MHTNDRLAAALLDVGLKEMATKAATGWYHDFMSPLDMPIVTLVDDLAVAASKEKSPVTRDAIIALRKKVMNGDFDATKEESDAWAASEEGQATFSKLLKE